MKKEFFRSKTSKEKDINAGDSLGEFDVFDFDWNDFKSKPLAKFYVGKIIGRALQRLVTEVSESSASKTKREDVQFLDRFLVREISPTKIEIKKFVEENKNNLGSNKKLPNGVTEQVLCDRLIAIFNNWIAGETTADQQQDALLERIKELDASKNSFIATWLLERFHVNQTYPASGKLADLDV